MLEKPHIYHYFYQYNSGKKKLLIVRWIRSFITQNRKNIPLFNFVYDGFCHDILTTIQKIIMICFKDIGFPAAAIFKMIFQIFIALAYSKF